MAEGIAKGDGGGGPGGQVTQFAMGMALANQMLGQVGGVLGQTTPPAAGHPPAVPPAAAGASGAAVPELLSPAEAAQVLGVTETDVIQALNEGTLKGKRIGTAWRITRVALNEFLAS
jgi:hypothetical protein